MDETQLINLIIKAKQSALKLSLVSTGVKNKALSAVRAAILTKKKIILQENQKDINYAKKKGISNAMIERLTLNEKRIKEIADAISDIIKLDDPIGKILEKRELKNKLIIEKVSVPIGLIGIIYESRPNLTAEIPCLCIKSGNAVILKGGSEALKTNRVLHRIVSKSAYSAGIPENSIIFIDSTDRSLVMRMLKMENYIDLVIPRGGYDLVRTVSENTKIPILKHDKGLCHTYVDSKADIKMALAVCCNAKCQRPGVCNAMETLIVHKDIAEQFLPKMVELYEKGNVELRGCKDTLIMFPKMKAAKEEDWDTEYDDLVLSVKIIKDIDEAINFINKHGSRHSEAIITKDKKNAEIFLSEVDAACVYVNASTRFTDGFEFGMGAEIGISTQKFHARGPMGLKELVIYKYKIRGNGQLRK